MPVPNIFNVVGGRPEINTDISGGLEVGAKLDALRSASGPAAFLNTVLEKRKQEKLERSKIQQEETKARSAKILDILQNASMAPEGSPLRQKGEELAKVLDANPAFSSSLGLDPDKLSKVDGNGLDIIKALQEGDGFAPGTTANVKLSGNTSLQVPLNRKLTSDETAAVSAYKTFKPQVEELKGLIEGGIFPKSGPGRLIQQARVDSETPLTTMGDKKLAKLQGLKRSIIRYAFGEGGKALSGTEKKIVLDLMNVTGKSDEQIITDYSTAIEKLRIADEIARGGLNAVNGENTNTSNINSDNLFDGLE